MPKSIQLYIAYGQNKDGDLELFWTGLIAILKAD
jgi:hypothetical protein